LRNLHFRTSKRSETSGLLNAKPTTQPTSPVLSQN